MRIIEIKTNEFGGHRNQTINTGTFWGVAAKTFPVPEGWAIIPEDMVCENFPFGDVVVDDSVPPVVIEWIPGVMPDPEPEPEPEPSEPSVWDELQAAYEEGVNGVD